MTITDITSYDVLADPPMDGVVGEYQLDNYKKNIGNNRLNVFLASYRSNYDTERQRENNAGCNSIVNDVLNTLYQRCVPTGRFLINASKSLNNNDGAIAGSNDDGTNYPKIWNIMDEAEAKELLHAILKGVSPPDRYKQQQQQQQQQVLQQQQQTRELQSNLKSNLRLNSTQNNNNQKGNSNKNQDDLKRRRRSSLLRRSASESMLDDAKKVTRFDLSSQHRKVQEEPEYASSSSFQTHGTGTVSLNRMDVVLTSSMDSLDPNCRSIGNNRLHILVAMQSGKYQPATPETKEVILEEVIETVKTFWKGRFLRESSDGNYEIVKKTDAKQALRLIFDMRSGQRLSQSQSARHLGGGNRPDAFKLSSNISQSARHLDCGTRSDTFRLNSRMPMRHVSTSAIPTGNTGMVSNDTKHMLSRHGSMSMVPTPQQQGSSMDIMGPPVGLTGISDLRSAAVRSLQKQKARQKIANRLEKVSMKRTSNFGRSASGKNNNTGNFNNNFTSNYNNNTDNMSGSSSSFSTESSGYANSSSSFSRRSGGLAKRREGSIFGALDPSVMDEIVGSCFDEDEESDDK